MIVMIQSFSAEIAIIIASFTRLILLINLTRHFDFLHKSSSGILLLL